MEGTPCSLSSLSSQQVSFTTDISFVGSEMDTLEEDSEEAIPPNEYYHMVMKEQEEVSARTNSMVFRWSDIAEGLAGKHPYFVGRSKENIRARFKYIKKQIKKLK